MSPITAPVFPDTCAADHGPRAVSCGAVSCGAVSLGTHAVVAPVSA
ncbi:hypothetical protein IWX88_000535 [Frigoribacterium sp. CG_9.8]|nr:hypothetical protein [Frigoribacterium sp. CG_9.8]